MNYEKQLQLSASKQRDHGPLHPDAKFIYKFLVNNAIEYDNENLYTNVERIEAAIHVTDVITHINTLKRRGMFSKLEITGNIIKLTLNVAK